MIIKELIEELNKLDPNMIVVVTHPEDSNEPYIHIRKFEFDTRYWGEGFVIYSIKAGTPFLEL